MTEIRSIKNRDFILFGMKIIGEFGAMIALPIILFVKAGQWLDARFGTGIIMTVIAFIIAFAISAVMITRKAKKYGKVYQEMIDNK
jgi:hypothetical protein